MTGRDLDALLGHADPALIIVTTAADEQTAGCVVGFHTQCSIEPVRYAVWLSKANLTYRVALFATHFAVHFLDAADRDLAELFGGTSGDRTDKFGQCAWVPGPGGVPLLARCPNRLVLARVSQWDDGSDHVCLVGAPVHADAAAPHTPLRLSQGQTIAAGHEATERAQPASLQASEVPLAQRIATMTDEERRDVEDAAAGAGHDIDLSRPDELS